MPVARPEPPDTRVIAHIDLDCFYVQVEQRRQPELKGKPTAVVQYNPFRGGAIIAVGYEARRTGVTRIMRGDDARKICPDINLVQVPVAHGKADLTIYRDAGSEVVEIFSRMGTCERASIDEVYLDLTEAAAKRLSQSPQNGRDDYGEEVFKTHVVGLVKDPVGTNVREWFSRSFASRSDQLLACGAIIVAELRTAVVRETQFTTSAGIAHNKMLAKLASGMHKPAQQTLVPSSEVQTLLANLPTKKIKNLGGKLGRNLESDLGVKTIGDLLPYTESKLQDMYGFNTGTWLWRVARGMNGEEVEGRTLPKSHGCGKTFPGPTALKNLDSIQYWLTELSAELQERLDEDLQLHNRKARLLVVHGSCHIVGKATNSMKPFPSKSCVLRNGKDKIAFDAVKLFKRSLIEFCPDLPKLSPVKGETSGSCTWAVTALSVCANNIYEVPAGMSSITRFFGSPATPNSKGKVMGTAVLPLSPSPVYDVSSQAGAMTHERICVDFRDEEVISLNEADETILNPTDASSSHFNVAASVEAEDPSVGSPHDGEDVHESSISECELPASPNAYSVLSRRERFTWTEERDSPSRNQSGICSPGLLTDKPSHSQESSKDSFYQSCKSVKRNLMSTLDPSAFGDKELVCTPKFGEEGLQPIPVTERLGVTSDCFQMDTMIGGTTPLLESQEVSARISDSKDKAEVILCSPLESRAVKNVAVGSDLGQYKTSATSMHHCTSGGSKVSDGSVNVALCPGDSMSSASLFILTNSRLEQAVLQGLSCKPLQDITSHAIYGESPGHVPEEDALQGTSTGMTIPHQTTPKHSDRLASERHPSVFSGHATLSACFEPCFESLETPTSTAKYSPPRNTRSTNSEDRSSTVSGSKVSPIRFKRTVSTRVDDLWEKWKSEYQKSTTSNRSLTNSSIGGEYQQEESDSVPVKSADAVGHMQGRLDENWPKKRKKASISDFFSRSPLK